MSASAALEYFREHMDLGDYLAEEGQAEMVWTGKDAERLRLQGACRQADFELMCQGEDPRTGMRLMLRDCGSQRRICFFAQVSAPKDVSIACLVGGDRRIAAWWKEAVAETVREIEAVAATRVRKAGACEDRVTGSMVAAVVTHEASRALDPQLHTHVAVMNLTFDPVEQRWKGLQPSGLFRHQAFLREVCFNALARRMIEGGYRVESVRGAGFRLAGMPEGLRERFSKRRRRILERAREVGARSQDALQAITAETREAKVRLSGSELRTRWTEEAGPELGAVSAMVANAVAAGGARVSGTEAAVLTSAEGHLFERRIVVDERVLLREALIAGRGRVELERLRGEMRLREGAGKLVRRGEAVASREALLLEQEVLAWVRRPFALSALGQVPAAAGLGEDQAAAVRGVLESNGRICVLQGDAGTGKTTSLRAVVAGIEAGGSGVQALAPSSGATEVLRTELSEGAETVQQFLANPRLQEKAKGRVLLIDEAGLLSLRELAHLMRVADDRGCRVLLVGDTKQHASVEAGDALRCLLDHSDVPRHRLTRIRRQRDPRYREAVRMLARGDAAAALDRFARLGAVRQMADGSALVQAAAETYVEYRRSGKSCLAISPVWSEIHRFHDAVRGRLREAQILRGEERTVETVYPLKWTREEKRRVENYEVGDRLTFYRDGADFRRHEVLAVREKADGHLIVEAGDGTRYRLNPAKADGFDVGIGRTIRVAVGETLRIRANLREARLNNGDLVEVAGLRDGGGLVLSDGREVPATFRHYGYGYGSTSQGAQGKTVDCGILLLGPEGMAAANLKQAYVSNSRFREEHVILTTDLALARERMGRGGDRTLAIELLAPEMSPWAPGIAGPSSSPGVRVAS